MWRRSPNSDVFAFGEIDREAPIYRPLLDIVEGALQRVYNIYYKRVFLAMVHSPVFKLCVSLLTYLGRYNAQGH